MKTLKNLSLKNPKEIKTQTRKKKKKTVEGVIGVMCRRGGKSVMEIWSMRDGEDEIPGSLPSAAASGPFDQHLEERRVPVSGHGREKGKETERERERERRRRRRG
jgi:hypothetical protein